MVYATVRLFSNNQVVRRISPGSFSDNTWEAVGIGGEIIEISTPTIFDLGGTPKNVFEIEYVFGRSLGGGSSSVLSVQIGYLIMPSVPWLFENPFNFSDGIVGLKETNIIYFQPT